MSAALLLLSLFACAAPAIRPTKAELEKACRWVIFEPTPGEAQGDGCAGAFKAVCVPVCPKTHRAARGAWPRAAGGVCVPVEVKTFAVATGVPAAPWKHEPRCPQGKHPQRCDHADPAIGAFVCVDDR